MNAMDDGARHIPNTGWLVTLRVVAVLGCVAVVSADGIPQSYDFVSLDVPNGQGNLGLTALQGVNDRGDIVGEFAFAEPEGFLLRSPLHLSRTGCSHATSTNLSGINNTGAVSGSCFDGINHGFFRTPRGRFILIDVPDALITQATGLNDRDQVVGYFRDLAGARHVFVWDRGSFETFDLPGLTNVLPYPVGINNNGQIAGFFAEDPCNCNERGFVLSPDRALTTIDFPEASATLATALNDEGQVAGTYVDANSRYHGFVFDDGDFMTLDVPFPGTDFTAVSGINNHGVVVGRYTRGGQPWNSGFIAIPRRDPKHSAHPADGQSAPMPRGNRQKSVD